jgi:15-cis-phytoene synthase
MNSLKLLHTIRKYGTSYAIATAFFPKQIRDKVLQLYSFVRKPDNIVDSDYSLSHYQNAKEKLQSDLEMLALDYEGIFDDSVEKSGQFDEFLSLVRSSWLTLDDAEDFYAAMIQDCTKHRYESLEELNKYMYGSAVIVWLMMNKIMNCNNAHCNYHGGELADAMQLTNFLRDICEDYVELGRVYMPSEELSKFGLTHDDIIDFCRGKKTNDTRPLFVNFMKYMIIQCRNGYRKAEVGYVYLPSYARKPISLAWTLYEWILDKIEANNYDVFTKSARTTLFDKLKIIRTWRIKQKQ